MNQDTDFGHTLHIYDIHTKTYTHIHNAQLNMFKRNQPKPLMNLKGVCVCVCGRDRERARKKEGERERLRLRERERD